MRILVGGLEWVDEYYNYDKITRLALSCTDIARSKQIQQVLDFVTTLHRYKQHSNEIQGFYP